jgi:hypothetical protein
VLRRRAGNSPARLAVTLLALLAFALQSYVTQTHIHHASSAAFGLTFESTAHPEDAAAKTPGHSQDKYPANEDPSNCPLCQEILHAGAFVAPATLALFAPALSVSVIAIAPETAIVVRAVSHDWRGRAPPAA